MGLGASSYQSASRGTVAPGVRAKVKVRIRVRVGLASSYHSASRGTVAPGVAVAYSWMLGVVDGVSGGGREDGAYGGCGAGALWCPPRGRPRTFCLYFGVPEQVGVSLRPPPMNTRVHTRVGRISTEKRKRLQPALLPVRHTCLSASLTSALVPLAGHCHIYFGHRFYSRSARCSTRTTDSNWASFSCSWYQ